MISHHDYYDIKSLCHGSQNPYDGARNLISYPGAFSQRTRLKGSWTNISNFEDQTFPALAPLHIVFLLPLFAWSTLYIHQVSS